MREHETASLSGWWYLSFVDEVFLGGCVVRADGMIAAVREAHRLGINPGGEVMGVPLPATHVPDQGDRERLLTRELIRSVWQDAARLGDVVDAHRLV